MDLHERLREHLANRSRTALARGTRCAVLVPLLADSPGYRLLYTLRSEHLPSHRGQVAFPGGKHSSGDADLLATALREAHEEVGIAATDVDILGPLDDVYTAVSDFVVTPYVGLLPAVYPLRANPAEVSDLFTVTLDALEDPAHRETQQRQHGSIAFEVEAITAGTHTIWGVTHRITCNFLECISELRSRAGERPKT